MLCVTSKVAPVTIRKQVPEEVRIAIAQKISELLDERRPDGKKVITQAALGTKLRVSQEAARRAREPDGVTPAIVDGMAKAFSFSVGSNRASDSAAPTRIYQDDRQEQHGSGISKARDRLYRRYPGRKLEIDALIGGSKFIGMQNASEADVYEALDDILRMGKADSKGKLQHAPIAPHPKKPPKVGR